LRHPRVKSTGQRVAQTIGSLKAGGALSLADGRASHARAAHLLRH
jgi:hypothetical protein